jgi:uncharacterized membrane protein
MTDLALARAVHVVGVVLWIGGVGMVTTVLLPAALRLKSPGERVAFFESIERRFAAQARVTTLLVGVSGLYLVERLELWARFGNPHYWWMHAMVALWAVFTLVLFVLEPLVLHQWFLVRASSDSGAAFRLAARYHWALLILSLVTIAGAAAGSHGLI